MTLESIVLPYTGAVTTRLGLGCAGLLGGNAKRQSHVLLDAAWEAGIRHFDTAPAYGAGVSEYVLGEFLHKRRQGFTVTTKYGLARSPSNWRTQAFAIAQGAARPIARRAPGLTSHARRVTAILAGAQVKASFTAPEAADSLERSLRALRIDRLDIMLMHEALASDLGDGALLEMLEAARSRGVIGAFGVGAGPANIPRLLADRPAYCDILQFRWSILDARSTAPGFHLHHGTIGRALAVVRARLTHDPLLRKQWSEETGHDLSDDDVLSSLMLRAALEVNPTSIVLFWTRRPARIVSNVAAAENTRLSEPARRLWQLVQVAFGQAKTVV